MPHVLDLRACAARRPTSPIAEAPPRLIVRCQGRRKQFSHSEVFTMRKATIIIAGALFWAAAGALAQAPNDAQIASIVVTANQVDIDAGKLAESASGNADVKAFAQRMVTDHTGVNKSAVDLVTKLKVTPEDNATSHSLKSGGEQNLTKL